MNFRSQGTTASIWSKGIRGAITKDEYSDKIKEPLNNWESGSRMISDGTFILFRRR